MYRRPALRRSLKPCTAEGLHPRFGSHKRTGRVSSEPSDQDSPVSSGFWTDVQLSVAGFTMDAKSATETIS